MKRAAVFTDIHFGKKQDSLTHNQDCLRFLDWFIEQFHAHKCDSVIFMGDYFESEVRVGVETLYHAWIGAEKLNALGVPVYWLVGNHDMFYRTRREVNSVCWLNGFENIRVFDRIEQVGDVLFCPYLVGTEYMSVPEFDADYVFGHFALPLFLVNSMYEMKDHGGIHADHFTRNKGVYSGHFHKRQLQTNKHGVPIWYIGNTFPMDFNDLNDRDRGMMIWSREAEPLFLNWPEAPNYSRTTITAILDDLETDKFESKYTRHSIIDCQDDVQIDPAELIELRNLLADRVREFSVFPSAPQEEIQTASTQTEGKRTPELVIDLLNQFQDKSDEIDRDILIDLWSNPSRTKEK